MLLFLPLLKVTAEKQECGIFKSKLRKFTARCVTELLPDDLSTILVFFFLKKTTVILVWNKEPGGINFYSQKESNIFFVLSYKMLVLVIFACTLAPLALVYISII